MARVLLISVAVLFIALCGLMSPLWAQEEPEPTSAGEAKGDIVDAWMREVAVEGVDYEIMTFRADGTFARGWHVGAYAIDWLVEGTYLWSAEAGTMEMTVTSAAQEPELVGVTAVGTATVVSEESLSWTAEGGERIVYTRGVPLDLPNPTAATVSSWGRTKAACAVSE